MLTWGKLTSFHSWYRFRISKKYGSWQFNYAAEINRGCLIIYLFICLNWDRIHYY
jgi:hypothetical protein